MMKPRVISDEIQRTALIRMFRQIRGADQAETVPELQHNAEQIGEFFEHLILELRYCLATMRNPCGWPGLELEERVAAYRRKYGCMLIAETEVDARGCGPEATNCAEKITRAALEILYEDWLRMLERLKPLIVEALDIASEGLDDGPRSLAIPADTADRLLLQLTGRDTLEEQLELDPEEVDPEEWDLGAGDDDDP